MCGRFTNQFTWRELVELYRITEPYLTPLSNLEPRFNFAPTDTGPVIRLGKEGRRQPAMMRWGLVPSWSKDAKGGAAMINAKAEAVAEKPSYRKAFVSRGGGPHFRSLLAASYIRSGIVGAALAIAPSSLEISSNRFMATSRSASRPNFRKNRSRARRTSS
jgi:hypothetical protein